VSGHLRSLLITSDAVGGVWTFSVELCRALAARGVRVVDVACPGFAVDCLETLEEVALRYRTTFLTNGGKQFRYIPALNDGRAHATALVSIALRHLSGWV